MASAHENSQMSAQQATEILNISCAVSSWTPPNILAGLLHLLLYGAQPAAATNLLSFVLEILECKGIDFYQNFQENPPGC